MYPIVLIIQLITVPLHVFTRNPWQHSMSRRVFSLEGKGLKFNSAADIEPYLKDLTEDVEEIRLSGNTLGVEASIALSKLLRGKTKLQVRRSLDLARFRI